MENHIKYSKCFYILFDDIFDSLLKEARTTTAELPKDMNDIQTKAALLNVLSPSVSVSVEERQLMGRFGVWLLVGLCAPKENTSSEILGRLLSMLFHWFHVTAYSFDGECSLLGHINHNNDI